MNHFQDSTPICILSFVLKKGSKGEKQKKRFSEPYKVFIGLLAMLSQKSILLALSKTCIPFLSLFFLLLSIVLFLFCRLNTKKIALSTYQVFKSLNLS